MFIILSFFTSWVLFIPSSNEIFHVCMLMRTQIYTYKKKTCTVSLPPPPPFFGFTKYSLCTVNVIIHYKLSFFLCSSPTNSHLFCFRAASAISGSRSSKRCSVRPPHNSHYVTSTDVEAHVHETQSITL